MNNRPQGTGWGLLAGAIVISVTVVGYFTGLQAPMSRGGFAHTAVSPPIFTYNSSSSNAKPGVVPATAYSQMADLMRTRMVGQRTSLSDLKSFVVPVPASESEYLSTSNPITVADKNFALAARALNRAFNGAPPTVPHPVDQISTQSCLACHGEGFNTSTLRASKKPSRARSRAPAVELLVAPLFDR